MARTIEIYPDEFYKEVAIKADAIIRGAASETVNEYSSKQLRGTYHYSVDFKERMAKLIRATDKPRRLPPAVKRLVIIAAIITALMIGAMSVSAVREAVYKFFMSFRSDHAVITYEPGSDSDAIIDNPYDVITTYYAPSYIPDGYVEIIAEQSLNEFVVVYSKGDSIIEFKQGRISVIAQADIEEIDIDEIVIDGKTAYYFTRDNVTVLYWEAYEYSFALTSDRSVDVIVDIAQSIEPIE